MVDKAPQGRAFALTMFVKGNLPPGEGLRREKNCRCCSLGRAFSSAAMRGSSSSGGRGPGGTVRRGFSVRSWVSLAMLKRATRVLRLSGSSLTSKSGIGRDLIGSTPVMRWAIVVYLSGSSRWREAVVSNQGRQIETIVMPS